VTDGDEHAGSGGPPPGDDPPPRASDAYGDASPFHERTPDPLLVRAVPVAGDIPGYRQATAGRDVLAGLTVAALALPAGMAYAELAGVSPVNGLYALLLPAVAYAVLGSSKSLSIGPEGSIAALVAAAILPLVAAGSPAASVLGAALALMVGACFLLAWMARLGWIADYFSRPVLVGYIHGVVVVLIVGQLGKLFGISVSARDPIPQLAEVIAGLGNADPGTVAVSAVTLAVLFVCRFRLPRIPAALLVVIGMIGLSWWFDMGDHGIAVVGHIPSGLPSVRIPTPPAVDILQLIPAALGIFLVCTADEILTARSFAGRRGQHVRVNQELLAMAAATAGAGFTQGFPIGASNSRTAVNDDMGARTQVAGVVAAGAVALVLVFLTAPVAYLPKAVLAAIIIAAATSLVNPAQWRGLAQTDRVELTIAAVTTACVIATGVLEALTVAVSLSIVDVVRRSARPHDAVLGWRPHADTYGDVAVHRDAVIRRGVVAYRLDDRLFFANADYVIGRIHEAVRGAPQPVRWVVFDAEAMTHVDTTGLDAFARLVDSLAEEHISIALARVHTHILGELDQAGLVERIGQANVYPTVRAAVSGCIDAIAAAHRDG
jgi:SulP family sulfate permease